MTFITDLSNEILALIFSFLPISHCQKTGDTNCIHLLVLRSVSRRFRHIVNNADFWLSDNVDVYTLYKHQCESKGFRFVNEHKFFQNLFTDTEFVTRLSRRIIWRFSTLEFLIAVINNIPKFYTNCRKIELKIGRDFGVALEHLANCSLITHLSVRFDVDKIDLAVIGKIFPYLQHAIFVDINDYEGGFETYAHLRTLKFHCKNEFILIKQLLPLRSSKHLMNLGIGDCFDVSDDVYNGNHLNQFENLIYLSIGVLTPLLCELLNRCTFQLRHLDIIAFPSISQANEIGNLFSAQCVTQLEILTLFIWKHHDAHHNECQYCELVVDALTSCLTSVRILSITMCFDISWYERFARMSKLEVLKCRIYPEFVIDTQHFRMEFTKLRPNVEIELVGIMDCSRRTPSA